MGGNGAATVTPKKEIMLRVAQFMRGQNLNLTFDCHDNLMALSCFTDQVFVTSILKRGAP